jgi:hypothetical protein
MSLDLNTRGDAPGYYLSPLRGCNVRRQQAAEAI